MTPRAKKAMASLKKHIESQNEKIQNLEGLLNRALKQEVWYWQGDGFDFPDSIGCPVIMSAETLREILLQREAAPWVRQAALAQDVGSQFKAMEEALAASREAKK